MNLNDEKTIIKKNNYRWITMSYVLIMIVKM